MFGTGPPFNLLIQHALIVLCLTTDNQTAPITGFALSFRHFRGKYDRIILLSFGYQFSARFYNQGSLCVFITFDDSSRFNGQCRTCSHINPSFQQVCTFGKGLGSFEYKFLVTISYYCSFFVFRLILIEQQMITRLD